LSSGDTLVSIGFPKKFNHIIPNEEQQNSSMQIERCVLFGKCIGTDAVEGVMRIDFSCKNLKNIDGMSGSPVFKLDDKKKLKFVGMVISADTKSGKCLRFLNVNWLNIYLMQTDLAFPYSSQGLETLEQIANNYLKDLEHLSLYIIKIDSTSKRVFVSENPASMSGVGFTMYRIKRIVRDAPL